MTFARAVNRRQLVTPPPDSSWYEWKWGPVVKKRLVQASGSLCVSILPWSLTNRDLTGDIMVGYKAHYIQQTICRVSVWESDPLDRR